MSEFFLRWQHLPEDIDPVFLSFGALQIRYYGLMYLCSFLVFYALMCYRIKHENVLYTKDQIEDFLSWAIVGVLLGARLGYCLFYNFDYYFQQPLEIIWPVHVVDGRKVFGISGLSYHGGLIGAMVSSAFFCRLKRLRLIDFADFLVPAVPLGYMFGRIGNFLNNELYGRVTVSPWGMYFPGAPSYELRHPSQLYEAFLEGLVLFIILWPLRKKGLFPGALVSIYLMGYAFVRFFAEYWREPDAQLGFLIAGLSMGQLLSLAMFLTGLLFYYCFNMRSKNHAA